MNFGEAITLAASDPEKIFIKPVGKWTAVCFGGSTSNKLASLQLVGIKEGKIELKGNYWIFADMVAMEWEQVTIESLIKEAGNE